MNGDVTIRDVMTREFVGASEGDDLLDTVSLMLEEQADCAVVLRGSEPVGVLTERDVLRLVVGGDSPETVTVGEAMQTEPHRIGPDESVSAAADRLAAHDARRLVVWDDGIVGLVTERDLLTAAAFEPAPEPSTAPTPTVATPADGGAYESQSICEACGSLARELMDVNGQLLCPDCRDV